MIAFLVALGGLFLALGAFAAVNRRSAARPFADHRPQSVLSSAAALGGEHLSAATVLVFTGLIYAGGLHHVWLAGAVGAGYVLLLLLVVEPLRRSRVYSLSDFVEWRLDTRAGRRIASLCVVVVCLIYLLAQYKLVGDAVTALTPWPAWVGWLVLGGAALTFALVGTVGSSTGFQALLFWVALAGFAVPAAVLVAEWARRGAPEPVGAVAWAAPAEPTGGLLGAYSLGVALVLGVVGLPKFVTRFYMAPDVSAVRATALLTLALTAPFVLVAVIYAVLARIYADAPGAGPEAVLVVLRLPELVSPGGAGIVLSAMLMAGAASATLSVAVALSTTIGSYLAQCVLGGGPRTYRTGVVLGSAVPAVLVLVTPLLTLVDLATLLTVAFHCSAATLAPMLLLGIWWRGLTAAGATAGLFAGLLSTLCFAGAHLARVSVTAAGWQWCEYPALLTVPLAFAVMVGVSLADRRRVPDTATTRLARMHGGSALRRHASSRE